MYGSCLRFLAIALTALCGSAVEGAWSAGESGRWDPAGAVAWELEALLRSEEEGLRRGSDHAAWEGALAATALRGRDHVVTRLAAVLTPARGHRLSNGICAPLTT